MADTLIALAIFGLPTALFISWLIYAGIRNAQKQKQKTVRGFPIQPTKRK